MTREANRTVESSPTILAVKTRTPRGSLAALASAASLLLISSIPEACSKSHGEQTPTPPAGECAGTVAGRKQAFFGDLHVHTNRSFDAYFYNTLNGPREAYRFAKGEPVGLPCDVADQACVQVRLARPLDFTAVTDHSEYLGGFASLCGVDGDRPDRPAFCKAFGTVLTENIEALVKGDTPLSAVSGDVEIPDAILDTTSAWADSVAIAESENEPCAFTSFAAYEFSAQPSGAMLHRNVIFDGTALPSRPISSLDTDSEWVLFDSLEAQCANVEGCRYLTIPHNSNLSDGRMFPPAGATGLPEGRDGAPLTRADAELRARADRLIEMVQHKGESECAPGLPTNPFDPEETDAACRFEKAKAICAGLPSDPPECKPATERVCTEVASDGSTPDDCTAPLDMVRNSLAEGLRLKAALGGVDPYKLGFAAATDTHNGTPGFAIESEWRGHGGILDAPPTERLGHWSCEPSDPTCTDPVWEPRAITFNPGGLTGVWAEENTRTSIFDALSRREAFATSGTRILVKSYGSFGALPADACARVASGQAPSADANAAIVPMGADLPPRGTAGAPQILVWAAQDAGDRKPGTPLERIDVVKGWVDASGTTHTKLFKVAGADAGPAPASDCSVVTAAQPEQLCGVFTDPEFDAAADAFYYARVLENPSCRWNTSSCVDQHVDCGALDPASGTFAEATGNSGYEGCCTITRGDDGRYTGAFRFDTIQERAWSSPIWYGAG
ncbi:MAG: DUF3604 domain-containing protein [bacterium]